MNYLIAILLPFVATLLERRVLSSVVLFLLQITIIGWPVAVIVAWIIIADTRGKRRSDRIARELRNATR